MTAVIEGKEGKSWDESVYVTTVAFMVQTKPETDDHSFRIYLRIVRKLISVAYLCNVHYYFSEREIRSFFTIFLAILIILSVIL